MPEMLMTVLGPVPVASVGVTDAHNHVWIAPVRGAPDDAPQLADGRAIEDELVAYRRAGASGLVDCQPGECGRDGRVLARLSRQSGVHIIACTGYHRRRYYGVKAPVWELSATAAGDYFVSEIRDGLLETRDQARVVYPGFIKIAAESSLAATRRQLLLGAARASRETGYAIEMHTEKGAAVEEFFDFFIQQDVAPHRLIFCHVDKRPDLGLHRELAAAGVLLEYDTFYRSKYAPEENVWPLLLRMVAAGYSQHVAVATDMAEREFWHAFGGGPGLAGFLTQLRPRLQREGLPEAVIDRLMGGNIVQRLALESKHLQELAAPPDANVTAPGVPGEAR